VLVDDGVRGCIEVPAAGLHEFGSLRCAEESDPCGEPAACFGGSVEDAEEVHSSAHAGGGGHGGSNQEVRPTQLPPCLCCPSRQKIAFHHFPDRLVYNILERRGSISLSSLLVGRTVFCLPKVWYDCLGWQLTQYTAMD
jgi:hypothetical protein